MAAISKDSHRTQGRTASSPYKSKSLFVATDGQLLFQACYTTWQASIFTHSDPTRVNEADVIYDQIEILLVLYHESRIILTQRL